MSTQLCFFWCIFGTLKNSFPKIWAGTNILVGVQISFFLSPPQNWFLYVYWLVLIHACISPNFGKTIFEISEEKWKGVWPEWVSFPGHQKVLILKKTNWKLRQEGGISSPKNINIYSNTFSFHHLLISFRFDNTLPICNPWKFMFVMYSFPWAEVTIWMWRFLSS